MEDIERFQVQKVIDLRETLTSYCVLQFKLARKVRNDCTFRAVQFYRIKKRTYRYQKNNQLFPGSPSLAAY